MIGLIELCGHGLVRAGIQRHGLPFTVLHDLNDVLNALSNDELDGLVVEAKELEPDVREILLAARRHETPSLFVTRERSVSNAVEALREGATDCLVAPFELESLTRALDRLSDAGAAAPSGEELPIPFITRDPEVLSTLEMARSVAASDATVMIEGESGTGKELLAQLVHRASARRTRELVTVNCAALPAGLLESELFGHERGAFTGAIARTIGKFELAHGATILLDEIGELELGLQAKLLRVIQEKQVQRVGAHRPIAVDFRLVATTNRNLAAEARAGRFREDLFYRLNVLPIRLKPLRERPDDIRLLLRHFLDIHRRAGRPLPELSAATLATLEAYDWPGNVRELENLVERLVLTSRGRIVEPQQLGLSQLHGATASPPIERIDSSGGLPFETIREMERWLIVETLRQMTGNRTRASQKLGISLRTLRNKIREYTIDEPDTLPRTGTARSASLPRTGQHLPGEL